MLPDEDLKIGHKEFCVHFGTETGWQIVTWNAGKVKRWASYIFICPTEAPLQEKLWLNPWE